MKKNNITWKPEKIKNLRKKLNLTQKQLAKKLGFKSYMPIWEYETGRRIPNLRVQTILNILEEKV